MRIVSNNRRITDGSSMLKVSEYFNACYYMN